MKVVAVLQARLSSRRLPNKVLAPVGGAPMLQRQIERIRRSTLIDHLIVATSEQPEDDALAALTERLNVATYRGSLDDVLDRLFRAAASVHPAHVVRLTGDCPLTDPDVIDLVTRRHLDGSDDITTNAVQATFPDGLDVEVVRFGSLETAWREATLAFEREHVTQFFYQRPGRFRIGHVRNAIDLSDHRWTVDEPADLLFVRAVYDALYQGHPDFGMSDVLQLLEQRPDLRKINSGLHRNEGLAQSIAAEPGAMRSS